MKRLAVERHVHILNHKGCGVLLELVAPPATLVVVAAGGSAPLGDDGTVWVLAVEEDLEHATRLDRPDGVEGCADLPNRELAVGLRHKGAS